MRKSFFTSLIFLAMIVFAGTAIWAQGRPQEKIANSVGGEEAAQKIDYFLPYPGILPDHPLYPLKILRDRILDFLTRDPVKRVEFNLLMSDKRLNMGIYLINKGKAKLAETTVSKGEKYFIKALEELVRAKKQGRELRDLPKKLETALLKHEEVVLDLQKRSPEDVKKGYEASLKIIRDNQEKLRKIGE